MDYLTILCCPYLCTSRSNILTTLEYNLDLVLLLSASRWISMPWGELLTACGGASFPWVSSYAVDNSSGS